MKLLLNLLTGDDGQSLTEYGLILAVFIIVIIWAVAAMGPKVANLYSDLNNQIN